MRGGSAASTFESRSMKASRDNVELPVAGGTCCARGAALKTTRPSRTRAGRNRFRITGFLRQLKNDIHGGAHVDRLSVALRRLEAHALDGADGGFVEAMTET